MRVYAGKDAAGQPRTVPAERPISVRDILRHTAGFVYGAGPTPAHDAYVAADPLALNIPLSEASKRLATVPPLRKSVVSGKRGSVRVVLGGRQLIKKSNRQIPQPPIKYIT